GGLVPSLAHPGGNVTGISLMAPDLVGKQLEVLKEIVPQASRMALLRNPTNPASAPQLREAEVAARALGVRLQTLEARVPQEIDSAFAAMTRERAGALVVLTDSIFTNQRRQIAELAAERLSFAKISSHSVDDGPCLRDRARHARGLSIASGR